MLKSDPLSTTEERNAKTVEGRITSLFSGRGLVDEHIYFSDDCVVGCKQLQLGDNVSVEATRTSSQAGWIARRVVLVNDWDTDADTTDTETTNELLGMVTYYRDGSGLINEKHSFQKAKCSKGYYPIVNDFVQYEIKSCQGLDGEIISVKPLREKEFVGIITDVINRYGFIDNDVYFHMSACGSYQPRKGDCVQVNAMESKQRKANWRAVKVQRVKQDAQ